MLFKVIMWFDRQATWQAGLVLNEWRERKSSWITVNGSLLKTESTCQMPLELTRFKQLWYDWCSSQIKARESQTDQTTEITKVRGPQIAGGTPLYKLQGYVPSHCGVFDRFSLQTGIHFAHFGLESGIAFEGTTGAYESIYRFNSKWVRKKEKHANSKWVWTFFWFAL